MLVRILRHNNKGFTLAELLAATVVLLIGLLGLLQSMNIATEQNLRNAARDEALQISEEYMSNIRAKPFAQISSSPSPYNYPPLSVPSRLRGVSKNYTVTRQVTLLSTNSKLVMVRSRWRFKNTSTAQMLQSVVSMPTQSN